MSTTEGLRLAATAQSEQPVCGLRVGISLSQEQEDLFRAGLEAAAVKTLTSNLYHDSTLLTQLLQHKLLLSANSISEDPKQ